MLGKFEELNGNINTVLSKLLSSQNLCKYLYYGVNDPLSQPNITDTKTILFNHIFPTPTVPQVTDSAKSLITVVLDDFTLARGNTAFKTSKITFNVLCHIDLWVMPGTGKIRPYSILNEIDKLFNEQNVVGFGQLVFDRAKWIGVNDKFQGYQIQYKTYEVN